MAYSSIIKPQDYFNTKLYTGNGSTNALTGVGFQPDMVWMKSRTNNTDHAITDAVRGVTKEIRPNKTDYEDTASNGLTAFGTDGFTLGDWTVVNLNSETYASWNWKANGAGSSNTDGSINTTATSVNTTSGFSISQYTGAGSTSTVGHGLGVAPKVVLIKGLSNSGSWGMYHSSIGADKKILLNSTAAEVASGWMNSTAPTSSVFTVINDSDVGTSGYTYVAYSFAEKQGFSKFGTYTGNGSTDGVFIYTGFKPAFIIFKRTSGTDNWVMIDNRRLGYNELNYGLFPNTTAVEQTDSDNRFDLLSNGFKIRNSGGYTNTNGQTYVYMAFAESPFVSNVDGGLPTTAR